MEVGQIAATSALDKVAMALNDAAGVAQADVSPGTSGLDAESNAVRSGVTPLLVRDGFVERILGETAARAAEPQLHTPSTRVDNGNEAARLQTFARPHAPVLEPLSRGDTALLAASHSRREFAIPTAQLVPALLVGLQIEPATSWQLPQHVFNAATPQQASASDAEAHSRATDDEAEGNGDDEAAPPDPVDETSQRDERCVILDASDRSDWCEALTRALRAALATQPAPPALHVAVEQWQRGRCVVLACPCGTDPAGPAWAFVLWPGLQTRTRRHPATEGAMLPRVLVGLRVKARLQWSTLPPAVQWCHVRMVKEHHSRRGRQLVALSGVTASIGSEAPVPCEVQLGPLVARSPRWRDVCVHVSAARQVWAALGDQWSVQVLVCSQALVHARLPETQATPC